MPRLNQSETLIATPARERIANARKQLTELRRDRDIKAREARETVQIRIENGQTTDAETGTLSPAGIEKRRDQLEQAARDEYDQRITALHEQIEADTSTLRDAAGTARPALGDDALSQQRAVIAWEQSVKPRLDAGARPSDILASADLITAQALGQWGPSWMEAQAYRDRPTGYMESVGWAPPDSTSLVRAVDSRLAELDEDFGAWRSDMIAAEQVSAYVAPLQQHDQGTSKGTGIEAALQSHYAAEGVGQAYGVTAADPAAEGDTTGDAGEGAA